jgi:hypothetical protein
MSKNENVTITSIKTRLIPIPKWNQYHPYPSPAGLRHLRFYSKTNGYGPAFKRCGRRILIDEAAFFECVEAQNKDGD